MSGKLMDAARADAQLYVTAGGFESDIKITTPDGNIILNTTGIATKHHISFDTDGTPFHGKNAHITLSEKTLSDAGYPVRVDEEINLLKHLITVKDSSGVDKNYVITQNLPDEFLGLIVCVLGDI